MEVVGSNAHLMTIKNGNKNRNCGEKAFFRLRVRLLLSISDMFSFLKNRLDSDFHVFIILVIPAIHSYTSRSH